MEAHGDGRRTRVAIALVMAIGKYKNKSAVFD